MNQEEEKVARVYNFSAGPAVLPEEVLREAADEMLDYQGSGQSVMEMSHRSKVYDNIIKEAEKDLRELMNIPDNYKVLFLQGGASQFFAEVPMNLMKNKKAAYIITGQWAKKAFNEAKIYGEAVAVASSEDKTYSYIPDCSDLDIPEALHLSGITNFDLFTLVGSSILLWLFGLFFAKRTITRIEGSIMILCYVAYTVVLIYNS